MKTELNRTERATRVFLALLIGSLIWGLAINEENFYVTANVPISLAIPENYCILEQSTDSIQIVFWGAGWGMLNYQYGTMPNKLEKSISVPANLSYPAEQTISIETSDIAINDQISIRQIQPNQLIVLTDTIISKQLPIAVITSDGIPSRYRNVTVEPSFVTITGPSSTVLCLDSIATVPINPSSSTTSVPLEVIVGDVRYSSDIVQVSIVEPVFSVEI